MITMAAARKSPFRARAKVIVPALLVTAFAFCAAVFATLESADHGARTVLFSVSPFSAKWSKASSADSKFLDSLKPSADEKMDDAFKRGIARSHEPKTTFTHGETRVSLGPEAVRNAAGGSSISWRSPSAPEVEAAQSAAGSIGTGFGGGDTMRPRMRVSPHVRTMVGRHPACIVPAVPSAGSASAGVL